MLALSFTFAINLHSHQSFVKYLDKKSSKKGAERKT
jgi:hypothetical protein